MLRALFAEAVTITPGFCGTCCTF